MGSKAVKRKFSESVDGMPIKIVATSSPGTLIHTAVAGQIEGTYDQILMWAFNSHVADVVLTVEYGSNAAPDSNIVETIEFRAGLTPIIPGLLLQNSREVRAFASIPNVITVGGEVNRISD